VTSPFVLQISEFNPVFVIRDFLGSLHGRESLNTVITGTSGFDKRSTADRQKTTLALFDAAFYLNCDWPTVVSKTQSAQVATNKPTPNNYFCQLSNTFD